MLAERQDHPDGVGIPAGAPAGGDGPHDPKSSPTTIMGLPERRTTSGPVVGDLHPDARRLPCESYPDPGRPVGMPHRVRHKLAHAEHEVQACVLGQERGPLLHPRACQARSLRVRLEIKAQRLHRPRLPRSAHGEPTRCRPPAAQARSGGRGDYRVDVREDPPTWPVAAGSLVLGFAVAQATGVRPLGGLVLLAGAGWCARRWLPAVGPGRTAALLGIYLACFVASHLIADPVGTWPAVAIVAGVTGVSTGCWPTRPGAPAPWLRVPCRAV